MKYVKKISLFIALVIGCNTVAAPAFVNTLKDTVTNTKNTVIANAKELTKNNTELGAALAITALCTVGSLTASNKITRGSLAFLALTPIFSLFMKKPFWATQFSKITGIKQLMSFTSKAKNTRLLSAFVTCENKQCPGMCSSCKSRKMLQLLPLMISPFILGSLLKQLFTQTKLLEKPKNHPDYSQSSSDDDEFPDFLSAIYIDEDKNSTEENNKNEINTEYAKSDFIQNINLSTHSDNENSNESSALPEFMQNMELTDSDNSNHVIFITHQNEPTDSSDAEESDSEETTISISPEDIEKALNEESKETANNHTNAPTSNDITDKDENKKLVKKTKIVVDQTHGETTVNPLVAGWQKFKETKGLESITAAIQAFKEAS